MSVYEVSADHIGFLVNLGQQLGVSLVPHNGQLKAVALHTIVDRAFVAASLKVQNRASVTFAGQPAKQFTIPVPLQRSVRLVTATDLCQALQWVNCYRYQSCEGPEWNGSFALAFTDRLITELVAKLISMHSTSWEYDGAPCASSGTPVQDDAVAGCMAPCPDALDKTD